MGAAQRNTTPSCAFVSDGCVINAHQVCDTDDPCCSNVEDATLDFWRCGQGCKLAVVDQRHQVVNSSSDANKESQHYTAYSQSYSFDMRLEPPAVPTDTHSESPAQGSSAWKMKNHPLSASWAALVPRSKKEVSRSAQALSSLNMQGSQSSQDLLSLVRGQTGWFWDAESDQTLQTSRKKNWLPRAYSYPNLESPKAPAPTPAKTQLYSSQSSHVADAPTNIALDPYEKPSQVGISRRMGMAYASRDLKEDDTNIRMRSMLERAKQIQADFPENFPSKSSLELDASKRRKKYDPDIDEFGWTAFQRWRHAKGYGYISHNKKKHFSEMRPEEEVSVVEENTRPRRNVAADELPNSAEYFIPDYGDHPEAHHIWKQHKPIQPRKGDLAHDHIEGRAKPKEMVV